MSATVGTLTWQYGSNSLALDETNGLIVEKLDGVFGFPPAVIEASDLPTHGAYTRTVRSRARRITLGIWAPSTAARDSLLALLIAGQEGTLIASADGQQRTITARVIDPVVQIRPHGWLIAMRLMADWPWWAGDAVTYTFSEDTRPLFFPILPLRVTSGGVYSSATLTVSGNGITYPIISITGPADYVELRNLTTGETLRLGTALADGDTRTVVMGHVASVVDGAGNNKMGEASGTFWPLLPGDNTIEIVAPNTSSATQVSIVYRPSYAGAW